MKKFYGLFLLLLLVLNLAGRAQQFEWINADPVGYNQNAFLPVHTLCYSPLGKIIAARMDSVSTSYNNTVYGETMIECYDTAGLLSWSFTLGEKAFVQRMIADSFGNIYAGGMFMESLQLNGTDSIQNTGTLFNENAFLIKLNSAGNLLWRRNVSLSYPQSNGIDVMRMDPGNSCWYGLSDFGSQTTDIAELDNNGQDVQSFHLTGALLLGGLSFDPWRHIFISGATSAGTMSIGNLSVQVPETYMMYVARLTSNGQASWIKLAHDITFQQPAVVPDGNGGVFLGGRLMDSTAFDQIKFHDPQWVYDIFLTRVDSTGHFQWGIQVPYSASGITGDFDRADNTFLDADGAGHVYLTGISRGLVEWGPGVVTGPGQFGHSNLSVLSFDQNGIPGWALSGGSSSLNKACAVAVDPSGQSCYFAATVRDTSTFGPWVVNQGGGPAFILGKIKLPGTTGISLLHQKQDWNIYPNPSPGLFHMQAPALLKEVSVFDMAGNKIGSYEMNASEATLDLKFLSDGIYLMKGTGAAENFQSFIIISK